MKYRIKTTNRFDKQLKRCEKLGETTGDIVDLSTRVPSYTTAHQIPLVTKCFCKKLRNVIFVILSLH